MRSICGGFVAAVWLLAALACSGQDPPSRAGLAAAAGSSGDGGTIASGAASGASGQGAGGGSGRGAASGAGPGGAPSTAGSGGASSGGAASGGAAAVGATAGDGGQPPAPELGDLSESFPDLASQYTADFGQPPLLVNTDQTTDAPLLGNGDVGVAILGGIDTMTLAVGKNEFWSLSEQRVKALGRVSLAIPTMAGATYAMQQHLGTAEVTGTFTAAEHTVQTRTWVQADDTTHNWLITEFEYTGASPQEVSVSLASGNGTAPGTIGTSGDTLFIDIRADDADEVGGYQTRRVRMATRVIGTPGVASGNTLTFSLAPDSTVTLVTGISSNYDSENHAADVSEAVAAVDSDQLAAMTESHRSWWRAFWRKSFVDIPNQTIEKLLYASLYLLGSTSRTGEAPSGLWGNWILTGPGWNGDYTLNYNFEAPFYAAFPTNHVELADSYDSAIIDWLDIARQEARDNGWTGAFYRVHIGPPPNGSADKQTWNQKSCGAFAATVMIMHYYSTLDPEYAAKIYGTLKELSTFWQDYLRLDGDRYVIDDDAQHEGNENPQMNGVMSLGLVRFLLRGTIDISSALGVDAAERAIWQDRLDRLSDFPTFMRNGEEVFRYTEVGLEWSDGNAIGTQHIYPGSQIGLGSEPGPLQIARNMVRQMGRWADDNGTNTFYPAAARVGHDPNEILGHLEFWIAEHTYPNLHIHTGGGGIENLNTVPSTISEMLLQSFQGRLRVFPNWPRDQDAHFGDLRAYGALRVCSALRSGVVEYVRIVSEVGETAVLLNPWNDGTVRLYRNGLDAGTVSGAELRLDTQVGEVLHLAPDGTTYEAILEAMRTPLAEP